MVNPIKSGLPTGQAGSAEAKLFNRVDNLVKGCDRAVGKSAPEVRVNFLYTDNLGNRTIYQQHNHAALKHF